jgi:hypothetical protein
MEFYSADIEMLMSGWNILYNDPTDHTKSSTWILKVAVQLCADATTSRVELTVQVPQLKTPVAARDRLIVT